MKIIKNYIYNLSYQVLIVILPLILAPYVSRVIGPEGVGVYSYSYSIVTIFGLFSSLGITSYGNREIAKCGDDKDQRSQVFWEIMMYKFVCSIIVFIGYMGYLTFCVKNNQVAFYFQIFNLLSFMLDISWFFEGVQNFRIKTIRCAVVKIISVFLVFYLIKDSSDTNTYVLILSLGAFFIQASLWFFLPRYISLKFKYTHMIRRHGKYLLLLSIPVFARYFYNTTDRIMLGALINMEEVGYYENVQSITLTITNVLTSMGAVIMPQMTFLYAKKEVSSIQQYNDCVFHLICFLAVGAMFGFMGIADTFIPSFYGDKFYVCVPLLKLIAPTIVFVGLSDIMRSLYLLPKYKDKEYVTALVFGAAANFIINFMLIPQLKSTGAIIGTLAAEFFVLFIQGWFIRKEIKLIYYVKKITPYLLAGSLILISSTLLEMLDISLIITCILQVMIGSILYSLCICFYIYRYEKDIFQMIMDLVLRLGKKEEVS